jgi:putative transposase
MTPIISSTRSLSAAPGSLSRPSVTERLRDYDADLYKERNRIERFFNKLKQFRRVATRYDKLLSNFMGFVKLAAIAIWIK